MCVSSHKLLVLSFLSGEQFFLMKAVLIGFSSLPLTTIFNICVTLRQLMLMELFRFALPFSYSFFFTINGFIHGQQFPLIYAFLKIDKIATKQVKKLYERSSNISSLMLFGHERERLTCTLPTNSKLQLASTQPKMIIVLPLRSLKVTLMGNWEKAQSTYSSRSNQKLKKAKERTS